MAKWLGLDITDSSVRLALLNSSYRSVTVEALREERLVDHGTVSATIRAALGTLKADAVATAIVGERGFVRQISLPAAAQKELANILSFEVESTLPMEMEDAVMDHRVLPLRPGVDEPDTIPIFAAVAYTEEVRDRISVVLRGSGQEPIRVGMGPLPLVNLLQVSPGLQQQTGPVAILDLDDKHADVVIMVDGEARYSRSLSRGALTLPAEARALTQELRQTLAAWRVQGHQAVDRLFIVGSGRAVPGLDNYLQMELGITISDLPALSLAGITPEMQASLPRFAKAIAMAMGLSRRGADLNLRQGVLEAQQSFQFVREKVPLFAGLAAAVLVSFGFSMFAEMRALNSEQTNLEQQLELSTEAHFGEKTNDPVAANELLENTITGKSVEVIPEMDAFGVMVAMSERIPDTIVHDIAEFDYNAGKVTIAGIVKSISDAQTIAKKLGEYKCFKDVNITRTTQLKNESKQKYTLEFVVDCNAGKKKAGDKKSGDKAADKTKTQPKGGK